MAELSVQIVNIIYGIWDLIVFLTSVVYLYVRAIYKYFAPPALTTLDRKVILITGSAGGIGRQICYQLAITSGATLICWDIDKRNNDKFVSELSAQTGVKAYSYQVDVSDRSIVKTAIEKVKREVGEIQIVINNAGMMPCRPFLRQSPEELEKQFACNVLSHFWILRELLPRMIELNDGHMVTMCSAAGLIGTRNLAAYSGTKHAVHGFIESLKEEIRNDPRRPNIKFTTVYPFACITGMMSGVNSYSRFPFLVKTVLQPEEKAKKLVYALQANYEHVYILDFISFAGTTAKCLLPEVQRLAADFMGCYVESADEIVDKSSNAR